MATSQQVSNLESNAGWTTAVLLNPVALVAVYPAAGTPVGIETPNISGANVTLLTSGSIGQVSAPVVISQADLQSGNLTAAQQSALANATAPGDVLITSTGVVVLPNSQVFVSATGVLNATAAGSITVQATSPSLTLNTITAGGDVNITAQGSILGAGTGPQVTTPGNTLLKVGTGTVGSPTAPIKVNVGGSVIVYTPPGNSNITGAQTTTLTLSANPSGSSIYGESVTFTATVSDTGTGVGTPTGSVEFYDGTTPLGLGSALGGSGASATSTITLSTLAAGVYPSISAVYNPNGNFAGSSGGLSFTVDPAPLTITADNASKTYGTATTFLATAFTETGLVSGDTIIGVDETSTGAPISAPVGDYNIVPFAAAISDPSNYTITYVDGTLTVNPAALTITANDASKIYGTTITFGAAAFTEIGLVTANGDTITGVTETSAGAPMSATVGTYPIVASAAAGSGLGNYIITYVDGTLTVNPAPLTITADNESKPFGTTLIFSGTAFTEIGLVTANGDTITGVTETSTGAPASATVGTYPIVASDAVGNRLSNYIITYVDGTLTVNQSIIVLDPTAASAFSLSGNAIVALAGGVFVDSSSPTALSANGNAQVTASVIDVTGGVNNSHNASLSPTPTTGAPALADPLAALAEPSTAGLTNYGAVSLSGTSSATIEPGIYTQISVSGQGSLTMNSGVYMIEGGGFSVSGQGSVSGAGVMIFNAGGDYPNTGGSYGGVSLSGQGSYNLSPPASGTYAGITIFQSRDNTAALSVSGNASGMTGTIYAPAAALAETGNAQLNTAIVAETMTVSGNGTADVVPRDHSARTLRDIPAPNRGAPGMSALATSLPVPEAPALEASATLAGAGQSRAAIAVSNGPSIFQPRSDHNPINGGLSATQSLDASLVMSSGEDVALTQLSLASTVTTSSDIAPLADCASPSSSIKHARQSPAWSTPRLAESGSSLEDDHAVFSRRDSREIDAGVFGLARLGRGPLMESILNDLAAERLLSPGQDGAASAAAAFPRPSVGIVARDATDLAPRQDPKAHSATSAAGLVVFGLASGAWARRSGILNTRRRRLGIWPR